MNSILFDFSGRLILDLLLRLGRSVHYLGCWFLFGLDCFGLLGGWLLGSIVIVGGSIVRSRVSGIGGGFCRRSRSLVCRSGSGTFVGSGDPIDANEFAALELETIGGCEIADRATAALGFQFSCSSNKNGHGDGDE